MRAIKEITMKRNKVGRLLSAAGGTAVGVLLVVPMGGVLAGAAGADSTCYTGCTTTATGITTSSGTAATPTPVTTSSSSSLAFTGADISEMAIVGVAAIGIGAVLVRRRRTTA
jgi:hypothetical protein